MDRIFIIGIMSLTIVVIFIGGITSLLGIIILLVRFILKRKNAKKYRIVQSLGIIFTVLGPLMLASHVVYEKYMGHEFDKIVAIREKYYLEHVETDTLIKLEKDTIYNTTCTLDTLEIKGVVYESLSDLYVKYDDPARGEAIANLDDGENKLNVYEYALPAFDDLVCVGSKIYVAQEKMTELVKYYNSCDFTYHYYYGTYGIDISEEFAIEMDNDMFFGLINYDEKYVTIDENTPYERSLEYKIVQTSADEAIKREFGVNVYSDGTYFVHEISNPLKNESRETEFKLVKYAVSDAKTQQFLSGIEKEVLKAKNKN